MKKPVTYEEKSANDATIVTQSPSKDSGWIEGLDIARAAAIFLVLLAHGAELLPEPLKSFIATSFLRPGWRGVRIFFALSGYLIGRQILGLLATRSKVQSTRFLARRWLRTVPTYWALTGIAYLLLPGKPSLPTILDNAFFIQNTFKLEPSIFEAAWSLAIEEWSYLALGLLALLSSLPGGQQKSFRWNWILTAIMAMIIFASMATRLHAATYLSDEKWESTKNFYLSSLTPCHMESFSPSYLMPSQGCSSKRKSLAGLSA